MRLMKIIEKENVLYTDDGLEAIIFTAQGDMRQVGIVFLQLLFLILSASKVKT